MIGPLCGESVLLLDGGEHAYPRMLDAIAAARSSIDLEVYGFARAGVGARFVDALRGAARRGVAVRVVIDGWGSARGGRAIAAVLREAGCTVRIHNRLLAAFVGRIGRNHRKILLVDDELAFLGGINIGDENVAHGGRAGWADVALEIRGPQCASLGRRFRGEQHAHVDSSLRILLCGAGGGWRLRRHYVRSFAMARERIDLAHGYFLPDRGIVRALTAAARRGVRVRLLLAGECDVPFARAATRSLHRRLLAAGVQIREWNGSVLHAKLAVVDRRQLLVGSFNLDPFSLVNLETLVALDDASIAGQAEAWIEAHLEQSRTVTSVEATSMPRRWLLDPMGRVVARFAEAASGLLADRVPRLGSDRRRVVASTGAVAPDVEVSARRG